MPLSALDAAKAGDKAVLGLHMDAVVQLIVPAEAAIVAGLDGLAAGEVGHIEALAAVGGQLGIHTLVPDRDVVRRAPGRGGGQGELAVGGGDGRPVGIGVVHRRQTWGMSSRLATGSADGGSSAGRVSVWPQAHSRASSRVRTKQEIRFMCILLLMRGRDTAIISEKRGGAIKTVLLTQDGFWWGMVDLPLRGINFDSTPHQ